MFFWGGSWEVPKVLPPHLTATSQASSEDNLVGPGGIILEPQLPSLIFSAPKNTSPNSLVYSTSLVLKKGPKRLPPLPSRVRSQGSGQWITGCCTSCLIPTPKSPKSNGNVAPGFHHAPEGTRSPCHLSPARPFFVLWTNVWMLSPFALLTSEIPQAPTFEPWKQQIYAMSTDWDNAYCI